MIEEYNVSADPATFGERQACALRAAEDIGFDAFPTVVDPLDDPVAVRWSAWPERLFVIDRDEHSGSVGRVVYAGGPGPFEFNPGVTYDGLRGRFGLSLEAFLDAYVPSR